MVNRRFNRLCSDDTFWRPIVSKSQIAFFLKPLGINSPVSPKQVPPFFFD